ncbi:NUDIX hydrolase [Corallococcus sp. bb12-1]|uniref:NUDIX hydrolase n=1 Tax=Corallococcus sp. bb12-1 TaxID=2996784 RepID=UPI00226DEB65|nr:NUDIX hydrolase [Corallococcus sp. bb12-1]MCY1040831.1 NUDIX hydrolase [Corallococcus sp. bb12-1]
MTDGRPWEGNARVRLAVQVLSGLLTEAERNKKVTRLVRDVLVREFSEGLPAGWPAMLDDARRFEVAKVLGMWSAYTPETYDERVMRAGESLLAHPPPAGWRPLSPDDELLRTLLPDEET